MSVKNFYKSQDWQKLKGITVDVEVNVTELKEAIKLIRTLKYEVIELKKQGLVSKVINKILLKKYSKKTKKYFY